MPQENAYALRSSSSRILRSHTRTLSQHIKILEPMQQPHQVSPDTAITLSWRSHSFIHVNGASLLPAFMSCQYGAQEPDGRHRFRGAMVSGDGQVHNLFCLHACEMPVMHCIETSSARCHHRFPALLSSSLLLMIFCVRQMHVLSKKSKKPSPSLTVPKTTKRSIAKVLAQHSLCLTRSHACLVRSSSIMLMLLSFHDWPICVADGIRSC